jgi:uncharacterized protein (TIGR02147 family)
VSGSNGGHDQFSQAAGLGSPNYLKLIVGGQRNLTVTNIHQFAKALAFSYTETVFFETLVLRGQSVSPIELKYYDRRLLELRRQSMQKKNKGTERIKSSAILDDSVKVACLLLCSKKNTGSAKEAIKKELGIHPEKIESIIKTLVSAGDLELRDNVYFLKSKNKMVHDPSKLNDKQRLFLKCGLAESMSTFEKRYPASPAKFMSILFTAPSGSLNTLFEKAKDSTEELVDTDLGTDEEAAVYRIQLQLYRMGKNEE